MRRLTMFEYNICTNADISVFTNQCLALEMHIPGLQKGELLCDVDGSAIQKYVLDGRRITVYNDEQIDAVFVESEIPLEKYFSRQVASLEMLVEGA